MRCVLVETTIAVVKCTHIIGPKYSIYTSMHLFFKGGLQDHRLVTHHELLCDFSLGSRLVARWCKLYFANHQAARVPETTKRKCKENHGPSYVPLNATRDGADRRLCLWSYYILLFNLFIRCVGDVRFNLKVHTASLKQKKRLINDLSVQLLEW